MRVIGAGGESDKSLIVLSTLSLNLTGLINAFSIWTKGEFSKFERESQWEILMLFRLKLNNFFFSVN